ncbi:MAG: transcription termination factor Rho [Acidimicrobiales bacterium]|nr:transcription termination factor Rho [Acidimicrobiales bacterium]
MSDAVVGRADLQKKDRGELQTIITALGGKPSSRAKKDDLITMVLDLTGTADAGSAAPGEQSEAGSDSSDGADESTGAPSREEADENEDTPDRGASSSHQPRGRNQPNRSTNQGGNNQGGRGGNQGGGRNQGAGGKTEGGTATDDPNRVDASTDEGNTRNEVAKDEEEDGNRRRRRRGRGRDREEEAVTVEPQAVAGNLDLRDEGYGFLRVDGALPSPEDVYVPLKTVRVYGLRKGDHVGGSARPAARNERNAALHSLDLINGKAPAVAKERPRFEDLTPVFPNEAMPLEAEGSIGGRILDLLVPLGKGQRALIVAPPETGASTLLADIAVSVQANHPDAHLIVMLLDDRPEEITDLSRRLDGGEVIASPFDRPPEEQVAIAEMAVERAKRLVEEGQDVVMLVDGITALVRAYNLIAPGGGRLLGGGVDASAIYPPKRFFGAARALEEGGSLTMVATVTAETGSPVDELILDEFRGTATAEIRLSRHLADRGVFPAIDAAASFNRAEDQLFDSDEAELVSQLRASVAGEDALETMSTLLEKIGQTASNAEMLGAIK